MRERSPRNQIARALMEGYDETLQWMRLNLRSAELALAAVPDGWAKIDGRWIRLAADGAGCGEFDRVPAEQGGRDG